MQCKLCCFPNKYDVILFELDLLSIRPFSRVQMERGCHGLERVTVAKFPTKKYSDKFFAAAENSQYVFISVSDVFVHSFIFVPPVYDVNETISYCMILLWQNNIR